MREMPKKLSNSLSAPQHLQQNTNVPSLAGGCTFLAAPATCSEGCDLLIPRILVDGRDGMEPDYTGEELSRNHTVPAKLSKLEQTLPLLGIQLIPATFTSNSITLPTVRN